MNVIARFDSSKSPGLQNCQGLIPDRLCGEHLSVDRKRTALAVTMLAALTVVMGVGPLARAGEVGAPEKAASPEERAFQILQRAMEKAAGTEDPQTNACRIAEIAMRIHPVGGVGLVKRAATLIAEKRPPPQPHPALGRLAALVAAQDREERDRLLALAAAEGQRALEAEKLWQPAPVPKGSIPFVSPERAAKDGKRMLAHEVALWKAILKAKDQPEAARKDLEKLLAEAEAAGGTGGDTPMPFTYFILRNLAGLDPEMLLAAKAGFETPEKKAELCYREAVRRPVRDRFAQVLITWAVKNGQRRRDALNLYKHFDLEDAWKLADAIPERSRLSSTERPRTATLCDIIQDWAWRDPEKALSLAEAERDPDTRRDLLDRVASVWALARPKEIERAVRNLDNEARKNSARKLAAGELARLESGEASRDRPELAPPGKGRPVFRALPNTMTTEGKAQRIRALRDQLRSEPVNDISAMRIEEVLRLDHAEGVKALDEALPNMTPELLTSATIYIGRVSPEGLLKIYRAHPGPKKLYDIGFFAALARADGAFAEAEARKLPLENKERDTALGYVAVGLARSDWKHAQELLAALPEERRGYFQIDPHVQFLIGHPDQAAEVAGRSGALFLQYAAASAWRETGTTDVMERMLSGLKDRDVADQVLAHMTGALGPQDPESAEKLLERIHSPRWYVMAACELATAMGIRQDP